MNESRSVLRDLAIALGVLALVFAGLFAWATLSREKPQLFTSFLDPDVPKRPEAAPPAVTEPEKEEIVRYVTGEHTVIGGESFSLITGMHWEDIFLWPDLYVLNDMKSGDPDLIFPDEIVAIYNRLGNENVYSFAEKKMILEAYMKVYRRYKAIGPEKNGSAWTLLWCGAKYDHAFLDIYADQINPEDLAVARRYIEEEGFLD
ncbi:MAG: hypothetical protein DRP60_15485 [Spirochaetes bacterium]|nr:MAG: hypothetical protein DRP60_15485 [Spirochaetota bacterium]